MRSRLKSTRKAETMTRGQMEATHQTSIPTQGLSEGLGRVRYAAAGWSWAINQRRDLHEGELREESEMIPCVSVMEPQVPLGS